MVEGAVALPVVADEVARDRLADDAEAVAVGTASGNMRMYDGGGFWNSTAAITRLQFGDATSFPGNLLAGSNLRIYGRT